MTKEAKMRNGVHKESDSSYNICRFDRSKVDLFCFKQKENKESTKREEAEPTIIKVGKNPNCVENEMSKRRSFYPFFLVN